MAHVANHENTQADRHETEPLEDLVEAWASVPEIAARQGVELSDVRRQIKDGELIAIRRGPNSALYVPAAFLLEGAPHPRLKGTFTVLRDGGMSDAEIVEWLFTPDQTLRAGGTPMGAMLAGHITEVRRRAMEAAV